MWWTTYIGASDVVLGGVYVYALEYLKQTLIWMPFRVIGIKGVFIGFGISLF